jgi:hypothetical protein
VASASFHTGFIHLSDGWVSLSAESSAYPSVFFWRHAKAVLNQERNKHWDYSLKRSEQARPTRSTGYYTDLGVDSNRTQASMLPKITRCGIRLFGAQSDLSLRLPRLYRFTFIENLQEEKSARMITRYSRFYTGNRILK